MAAINLAQVEALEYVPNAPLRKVVQRIIERGDLSSQELAKRAGLTRSHRGNMEGDSTSLKRVLGLKPHSREGGVCQKYIKYETAVSIIKALDLSPVDFGV